MRENDEGKVMCYRVFILFFLILSFLFSTWLPRSMPAFGVLTGGPFQVACRLFFFFFFQRRRDLEVH